MYYISSGKNTRGGVDLPPKKIKGGGTTTLATNQTEIPYPKSLKHSN